jgi:hypothetical protein
LVLPQQSHRATADTPIGIKARQGWWHDPWFCASGLAKSSTHQLPFGVIFLDLVNGYSPNHMTGMGLAVETFFFRTPT